MPPISQPTNAADYKLGYEDCANDVSIAILELQTNVPADMHAHLFSVKKFVEKFNEIRAARYAKMA